MPTGQAEVDTLEGGLPGTRLAPGADPLRPRGRPSDPLPVRTESEVRAQ